MHKLRDPNTFKGALAKIVQRLGKDWSAAAADVRERQIYNYTDPDSDQLPNLAKAFELDRVFEETTGEHGPIGLVWEAKKARIKTTHTPECPNKRTTDILRELGEAVSEEAGLPEEGLISPNQHMNVCKQWDDVIELCQAKKRDSFARTQGGFREVS